MLAIRHRAAMPDILIERQESHFRFDPGTILPARRPPPPAPPSAMGPIWVLRYFARFANPTSFLNRTAALHCADMLCAAHLGFIKPELPTLVAEPPTGEGWIHEIKHDGYRTLIVIDRGQVRAFTRNGNDWTAAYRRVVDACSKLACKTAVLDGEIVVQDENGLTDFDALRSAIYTAPHRIVFFAFDLLHLDGKDLRGCPLLERRALLRRLIKPDPRCPIQFSDQVAGDGASFFRAASDLGLEGIVSKRAASQYRSGPSRSWLKTKNMIEGEFILLGTERDANGIPWALLASHGDGELKAG
jgi:bifunctional non-homologous end joining protein LigD